MSFDPRKPLAGLTSEAAHAIRKPWHPGGCRCWVQFVEPPSEREIALQSEIDGLKAQFRELVAAQRRSVAKA